MSAIFHVLLAVSLTAFLAFQAASLVLVLRFRRAHAPGRHVRHSELIWTMIPVAVVLFLAARSWMAVVDLPRPAVASSINAPEAGVAAAWATFPPE